MMKFYYKLFVLVVFLTTNQISWSQDLNQPYNVYKDPQAPSAQIWQFATYGSKEQQLYTGTVSTSIPIYTYKDPDFEIPIALNYASNGYKPNQQAGTVGLGWALSAGGYVTRKVIGVRDDLNGYSGGVLGGYYEYCQVGLQRTPQTIFDNHQTNPIYTSGYDGFLTYARSINSAYETTPDQFTFNFLGHQGQFSLEAPKKVAVYKSNHPYGEYKVEFSNFLGFGPADGQTKSCIRITTGDGYIYTFDRPAMMGSFDIMDPSGNNYPGGEYSNKDCSRMYWPLTEIKAPNGRTVKFEYGETEYNINVQWHTPLYNDYTIGSNLGPCIATREYVQQLKRIIIDDLIIAFDHTTRTPEKHQYQQKSGLMQIPPLTSPSKLSKITVRNQKSNTILRTCDLEYKYGLGNPVLFLTKVHIPGEGTYSLDYFNLDRIFPSHATLNLDHWGYYNLPFTYSEPTYWNLNWNSSITPVVNINPQNQESIVSITREPRFFAAKQGMLKTIAYPTGGYTTFSYEPHSYTAKITRDLTNDNRPYLMQLTQEKQAGGVRISRITDYTTSSTFTTRTFYYKYCGQNGMPGRTSGILLHNPRYTGSNLEDTSFVRHLNQIPYPMDSHPIGYSEVIEKYSQGNYNVYRFVDYNEMPDTPYDDRYVLRKFATLPEGPYENKDNRNLQAEPYSNYLERGKLVSLKKYDADNVLKYEELNNWDTAAKTHFIDCVKHTKFYFYLYREYVQESLLKSKVTKEYTDNGPHIVTHDYWYNLLGQIVADNASDGLKRYWVYPSNCLEEESAAETLVGQNMLSSPIYYYEKEGGIELKTAYYYIYALFNKRPMLKEVREMKRTINPTASYRTAQFSSIATFAYNEQGRLISKTDKNNIITSYLWGYGGLYPVAVGMNLSYGELQRTAKDPDSGILLPASEHTIRQQFPDAELTTYDYIPYVGVSRITNPRGESTTYHYNENGKLVNESIQSYGPIVSYEYSSDKE